MASDKSLRYMQHGDGALTANLVAQADVLSTLRADAHQVLSNVGVSEDTVHTVQLVLSELVGNAVNAFGDGVQLFVEVHSDAHGVTVGVTDPEPDRLPQVGTTELDSADAESGRGLMIVGLLSEAAEVDITDGGKRVRCLIAR